ncbi:MAG: NUDIX hydrolase [Firmicutes bacterium]|nr:NUDIX hydrolase [Bacillota bacterium]
MKVNKVFSGVVFDVIQKDVVVKDMVVNRDVVLSPGGVGVLVVKNGKVLFVKQMRHTIDEITLEIPAGKLEYGEDPKDTGRRELNEEAGLDCEDLIKISHFAPTPGYSSEKIWIYEAINVTEAKERHEMDEDEDIELVWMDLEEAYQQVLEDKIVDGKTIIAIQHAMIKKKEGY